MYAYVYARVRVCERLCIGVSKGVKGVISI